MLNSISIKNLRSIENLNVEFKPMTILTGLNSSGKSTIIGAVNLLMQQIDDRIELNGDYVNFGTVESALYYWRGEDFASIEYNFDGGKEEIIISKEYSSYKNIKDISIVNQFVNNVLQNKIRYLSSDRISPEWSYSIDSSSYQSRNLGTKGENSISYLCHVIEKERKLNEPEKLSIDALAHTSVPDGEKLNLISNLNAWLGVVSPGVSITPEYLKEINKSQLSFNFSSVKNLSPFSVGFGLTHCLPIILLLLTSKKDDVVIIENPELNLHPEGQIEIGKLMSLVSANGVQVICETHSDHIVNSARICIKDEIILTEKLEVKYLELKKEEYEGVEKIYTNEIKVTILDNGKLVEPPSGFFDTWKKSLMELL